MNFIAELRRRHVIRTTSYYLGAAWMLIGIGDIFFPMWGVEESLLETLIWVMVAGIPVVAVLAWFFDTGFARPVAQDAEAGVRRPADLVVIVILGVLLAGSVTLQLRDDQLFADTSPLVAVVPFEDVSEVGDHVSAGLADELINLLVREPGLRLVALDLASSLGRKGEGLLGAVKDLKADFVVRGAVRVQSEQLRVSVRLIDVSTNQLVWSDSVDGSLGDVFLAQQQIAQRLKESLSISIEYAYDSGGGMLPTSAVDGYLRAAQLIRERGGLTFIQQARDELQQVVERAPDFGSAYGQLCSAGLLIFTRTEDPTDFRIADQHCEQARDVDPGSVQTRLSQARLYRVAGEPQRAADLATALVQSHPDLDDAHAVLAQAYWALGDLLAAEASFKSAVRVQDTRWANYLSLGNFYARQQRYEEAIPPFTRITELNPDDFIGWASLGVTLYEAGDLTQAETYMLKSLKLQESSRSYFNLGLIYSASERPTAAAKAFGDAVGLNPKNYRALMFKATSHLKAGDEAAAQEAKRSALKVVTELLEINGQDAYVRSNGALLSLEMGQLKQAEAWAEQARSDNASGNPKVQLNIGLVYYALGDEIRGIKELVRSIEMGYPEELFYSGEIPPAVLAHPDIARAFGRQTEETPPDA